MTRMRKYMYEKRALSIALMMIWVGAGNAQQPATKSPLTFASSASLQIPIVKGSLVVDGNLSDKLWESAISLSLTGEGEKFSLPGGESRIAICGKYLCLGARAPEKDRITAHSIGASSVMWQEDLIIWRIRYNSPVTQKNTSLSFAVNPLGGFCALSGDYYSGRNDVANSKDQSVSWANNIMVSSVIDREEWRMEAALPLEQIGSIGFLYIERIRPLRPGMAELRWRWPAANVYVDFSFIAGAEQPKPLWIPPSFSNNVQEIRSGKKDSFFISEMGDLPKQVWTNEEKKSMGISAMMEKSIRLRMTAFAEKEKISFGRIKEMKDWEAFRNERLDALRQWMGPLPERNPLRAFITSSRNYGDGFVIENIAFESQPGLLVAANLYRPEKINEKIPAVIIVHSLHYPKTQLELQEMGMTLARAGTAALVMDQLGAGERIQSQPWHREGYHARYVLGNQLYLAGESLIKWTAWDILRSIDLLQEKEYVDMNRIALIGAVAGGGDPAALAAILDKRIAAVIPFNFGEAGPEEHYLEGKRKYDAATADPGWAYWETTRNIPFSVSGQFFPWFLCAASAPRYFAYSIEMGWPASVEEEPAWARYKKVFGWYNALDRLAEIHGFGPFPGAGEANNISVFMRRRIDTVLNRWLNIPIPVAEYRRPIPESDLVCLTPDLFAQRNPRSAASLALARVSVSLDSSRKALAALPDDIRAETIRVALQKKLGDIEPMRKSLSQLLWSRDFAGFRLQAFTLETEPGITLPIFLLSPAKSPGNRPAVIAIAQGGKEKMMTSRAEEISAWLRQGIMVCLTDVRDDGELASDDSRGPGAMGLAANELMMGRTMIGSRLKDVRTVFQWLKKRPGIDPARIALWGDSFASPNAPDFQLDQSPGQSPGPTPPRQAEPLGPLLAILTALYERQVCAVAASGMLVSFSSVLEDRFCYIPQDIIIPGILQAVDLNDIVRLIRPKPVYLNRMVDGRNKPASRSAISDQYGAATTELYLDEETDPYYLMKWITEKTAYRK